MGHPLAWPEFINTMIWKPQTQTIEASSVFMKLPQTLEAISVITHPMPQE